MNNEMVDSSDIKGERSNDNNSHSGLDSRSSSQERGDSDSRVSSDRATFQAKHKRNALACIRCRTRHIRCPGGDPCKKCVLAKTKCEYVEADKKIVVSMKYLSKLHDDIARLKKDNAILRTDLKAETDQRYRMAKSPAEIRSRSNEPHLRDSTNNHPSSFDGSYNLSQSLYQHQQYSSQPESSYNSPDGYDSHHSNSSYNNSREVIHPSLDKHGRLIQSRTGEKVYVGSSSMTLFGLEIQNMVPSFGPSSLFPNSESNSPANSPVSQNTAASPKSHTTENSHTSQRAKRETEVLEKEGNAYKITLAKTNTRPGLSINFTLPSYSYAMLLVDTFINYNDGCFYFFNEGLVKRFLMNLYSGKASDNIRILKRNFSLNKGPAMDENTIKKDADDDTILETIWFCKILLIFAIGEMYLGTESDTHIKKSRILERTSRDSRKKAKEKTPQRRDIPTKRNTLPGSGFFYQASELFTGLFASGAIDNITKDGGIEVMLLYAFYLQVADCTTASYFYFGLALRSTLILGWHVDADKENLDRFELEHRRRIWWTVYMYERMLSSKAGLPLSFADDSVSTELPFDFNINLDDFPRDETDVRGYYIFPSAEYINNCVTITQINALILSSLYTKQPSANILPVVSDLVQKLINWRNALPAFLRIDFSNENLHVSRLIVNLMTEYFQGMNLAVRPLLFHFATKKLKELQVQQNSIKYVDLTKYSKNVLTLLNASFQASINTIKSIWALLPENMVALFGWMDREYLFTSASTLILFNASFGVHDATKEHLDHALVIFTKMKKLGNYPAALRRAQLLKLIKVLDFNGVMDSLLVKHDDERRDTNEMGEPINEDQGTFTDTLINPGIRMMNDANINQTMSSHSMENNVNLGSKNRSNGVHATSNGNDNGDTGMMVPPDLDFLNFGETGSLGNDMTDSTGKVSGEFGQPHNLNLNHGDHGAQGASESHLTNDSFNFNINVPSNSHQGTAVGDVYSNSDLAGIEGLTYIDEEQKLWNEITNDAVWLNVPGGNPNEPPTIAGRHSKPTSTNAGRQSATANQHFNTSNFGAFFPPAGKNNAHNSSDRYSNMFGTSNGGGIGGGDSGNLFPSGGYADIINEEFQDLMN